MDGTRPLCMLRGISSRRLPASASELAAAHLSSMMRPALCYSHDIKASSGRDWVLRCLERLDALGVVRACDELDRDLNFRRRRPRVAAPRYRRIIIAFGGEFVVHFCSVVIRSGASSAAALYTKCRIARDCD